MAWSVIAGTRCKSGVTSGRGGRDGSNLRITQLVVMLLALPELSTGATGIIVGRSRAEALLLLVMTA